MKTSDHVKLLLRISQSNKVQPFPQLMQAAEAAETPLNISVTLKDDVKDSNHYLYQSKPRPLEKAKEGALTYKDKFGKLNVNPNLIIDLDLNPGKLVCSRCGQIHRWLEEFCTAFKNKKDELIEPKLTYDQIKIATKARWIAGFFSAKDPNLRPERNSPSVQEAASAATDTRARLAQ